MSKEKISTNLKRLIKERGIKQSFIAQKIGISPQRMNDIISGRRQIRVSEVADISRVLNVTTDEILKNEEEQEREVRRE